MPTRPAICCASLIFLASVLLPCPAAQDVQPTSPTWMSTVRPWLENADYKSAAHWLKDHLKKSEDPDVAYAYLYCLYQNGDYLYLLARARTKRFAGAVANVRGTILIGLTYWRIDRLPEALQSWAAVLTEDPKNDLAWECVRAAIRTAPRLDRATLAQLLIRALNKSRFSQAFLLGALETIRGQNPQQAEKWLDEARTQFPESRAVALAFRDLYRQTGDVQSCRKVDEWLTRSQQPNTGQLDSVLDIYKFSIISDLRATSRSAQSISAAYRLPWPANRPVFCGSHEGRRETPHSDRGCYALDFLLPQGMPILAAREGIVYDVADRQHALGNHEFGTFILIDHGDGTFARYYHIRGGSLKVRVGQPVRQGDMLAESGRSGRCQSRHLHFEVLRNARWRLSGPRIYWHWQTIPIDFEETTALAPEEIPSRWLVSRNAPAPSR